MINLRIKILLIVLVSLGFAFASCGNKSNNSTETEQKSMQGKEYTSVYVCPMHCEGSGSHEPGVCPVCGMDYVKNDDHKEDNHSH